MLLRCFRSRILVVVIQELESVIMQGRTITAMIGSIFELSFDFNWLRTYRLTFRRAPNSSPRASDLCGR